MKVVRELDREPDLGIGGFRVQGRDFGLRVWASELWDWTGCRAHFLIFLPYRN